MLGRIYFGFIRFLISLLYDIESKGEDPCSAETPDDGWVSAGVPELDDYCYMKISQARDWQYSNDHCRHHGGDLASIHSKVENDYINGDYWVGLIKMQPGGQRKWTDKTIQDYTNWGEGGNVSSNIELMMYS